MKKVTVKIERLSGTNFVFGDEIEIYHLDEVAKIKNFTKQEKDNLIKITTGSNTFVLVGNNEYNDMSFRQIYPYEYN